ncbi:MAG: hypothetical protein AAGK22_18285 [Acidobacteriota bacterium]
MHDRWGYDPTMLRLFPTLSWLVLGLLAASSPGLPQAELVDRVVALVDGDAIFLSDLQRARALAVEVSEGAPPGDRQLLDRLIDERLRLHEVERFESIPVSLEEVDAQVEALRKRLQPESLESTLESMEMSLEGLRETFARQILLLQYVEERLGARVFVDLDDIRAYYDETLTPQLEARGEEVPALERVREQIRSLIREQRLDAEIVRWTEDLRRRADIVDTLDEEPEPPPR